MQNVEIHSTYLADIVWGVSQRKNKALGGRQTQHNTHWPGVTELSTAVAGGGGATLRNQTNWGLHPDMLLPFSLHLCLYLKKLGLIIVSASQVSSENEMS